MNRIDFVNWGRRGGEKGGRSVSEAKKSSSRKNLEKARKVKKAVKNGRYH